MTFLKYNDTLLAVFCEWHYLNKYFTVRDEIIKWYFVYVTLVSN